MAKITLPLPPSTNRYWMHWRNRVVLSPEARAYKASAKKRALALGLRPLLGQLCLRLWVYRAQRRGDLSNRIKVLEDALEGVAYENDSQVWRLEATLGDDAKNPRVEIEVSLL